MKNKIELKKMLVWSICVIIISNIIFGLISYCQYRKYTQNFNNKIGAMVAKVKDSYPNVDTNELIAILNSENSIDKELFRKYGIDLESESLLIENEKNFTEFLVLNLVIVTIVNIGILGIFLRYNQVKDKNLAKITRYIEDINNKKYHLDIEENSEDELSILKNEVYKTTIMLKEVAENSKQDKVQLKDSLSDISHQLKTPLTSIMIMLDNILQEPNMEEETRNEFLKDIKREIVSLNFLVNALLKLSKLDANSVKFSKKEERVENILKEATKNVAMLGDLKNVQIDVQGDSTSKIYCDFKWQVEAITNILKNGIEHSNDNDKIEILYEQNQIDTKIVIKDGGIGIEPEDLPHIFERFYKGKNSSSDSIGIGLALAKAIVEKDNGYIHVESKVGEGTTFTIKYLK